VHRLHTIVIKSASYTQNCYKKLNTKYKLFFNQRSTLLFSYISPGKKKYLHKIYSKRRWVNVYFIYQKLQNWWINILWCQRHTVVLVSCKFALQQWDLPLIKSGDKTKDMELRACVRCLLRKGGKLTGLKTLMKKLTTLALSDELWHNFYVKNSL